MQPSLNAVRSQVDVQSQEEPGRNDLTSVGCHHVDRPPPQRLAPVRIAEGFARQRLCVVSRPIVSKALVEPPLSALVVTDAGWFPAAKGHYRERVNGAAEAILIMCTEGAGVCTVGDDEFDVNAGDIVLIAPFTPHRYGASARNPWTIWWLHLTGYAVPDLVRELAGSGGLVQRRVDFARIVQLTDEALRFLERGESAWLLQAAAGCAWHMLGLLGLGTEAKRPDPVERAIAVMADRIAGSVSVAELSQLVNLSPSHFSALFRRTTGTSVLHHFIAMKMGVARELLDADLPIGEVARQLGFADPFYFSRQFRRFHGVNPSTYRAERRLPGASSGKGTPPALSASSELSSSSELSAPPPSTPSTAR